MKQFIFLRPFLVFFKKSKINTFFSRIEFTSRFNKNLQKHFDNTKPQFVFKMSTDMLGYFKIGQLLKSNIIYVTAANGENFNQSEMVALSSYLTENQQLQETLLKLNWKTIQINSKKPILPLKCVLV